MDDAAARPLLNKSVTLSDSTKTLTFKPEPNSATKPTLSMFFMIYELIFLKRKFHLSNFFVQSLIERKVDWIMGFRQVNG